MTLKFFIKILFITSFAFNAGDVLYSSEKDEYYRERKEMVQTQIKERGVHDELTLEAMREVPRHKFVPSNLLSEAYSDRPLPIGHGQTISQPYIVALMTSLLELSPGDRVLEIGAGSGYQAAVLAPICSEVYTIEIIPELAKGAAEALENAGFENVKVKNADGYYGWEEHAPYDGIVVTAAASYIPPDLIRQLKPGGQMVIPVGGAFQTQRLMLVRKDEEGEVSSESVLPVRFVPFIRE